MKRYNDLSIFLISTITLAVVLFTLVPAMTHAANDVSSILCTFTNIIRQAGAVVVALALLFFFWGLARFIMHAEDATKKEEGKNVMIWGIIALFVMVSFIGIISVLQTTVFNGGGVGTSIFSWSGCAPASLPGT